MAANAPDEFTTSLRSLSRKQSTSIDLFEQSTDDMQNLASIGITQDMCQPVSLTASDVIIYDVALSDEITNQVTVEENARGELVLNFYEGDKHDCLKFLSNGDIVVNGETTISPSSTAVTCEEIPIVSTASARIRNSEYSLTPYGNASDYTKHLTVYSKNDCEWGLSTLAGATTSAVATIICNFVSLVVGAQIVVSIFTSVATSMITNCKVYGMEDAYFSWKFSVYQRSDSNALDYYNMYTGWCYSRRNCAGTAYPHTYYYHNYFT